MILLSCLKFMVADEKEPFKKKFVNALGALLQLWSKSDSIVSSGMRLSGTNCSCLTIRITQGKEKQQFEFQDLDKQMHARFWSGQVYNSIFLFLFPFSLRVIILFGRKHSLAIGCRSVVLLCCLVCVCSESGW